MGYTDERGIYHPQHKEDGWSDEMNANLTALGRSKLRSDLDFIVLGHGGPSGTQMDGVYAYSDGLKKTTVVNGIYIFSFTEHVGSAEYRLEDPSGWVNPASRPPNQEFNITIPAGASLLVPEGVYAYEMYFGVASDGSWNPNTRLSGLVNHGDEWWALGAGYAEGYGLPWLIFPNQDSTYLAYGRFTDYITGVFWAVSDDTPMVLIVQVRDAPNALEIQNLQFSMVRIGG